jgi:hypothetical protein
MCLGMLPIVRYMGQACFDWNVVTRVLSEDKMMGTMVAPGLFFSTTICRSSYQPDADWANSLINT